MEKTLEHEIIDYKITNTSDPNTILKYICDLNKQREKLLSLSVMDIKTPYTSEQADNIIRAWNYNVDTLYNLVYSRPVKNKIDLSRVGRFPSSFSALERRVLREYMGQYITSSDILILDRIINIYRIDGEIPEYILLSECNIILYGIFYFEYSNKNVTTILPWMRKYYPIPCYSTDKSIRYYGLGLSNIIEHMRKINPEILVKYCWPECLDTIRNNSTISYFRINSFELPELECKNTNNFINLIDNLYELKFRTDQK